MTLLLRLWAGRTRALGGLCLALLALVYVLGSKVVRQRDLLAARPVVVERVVRRTVQGPTKIVRVLVERPGGERTTTTTLERGPRETVTEAARTETPVGIPRSDRYLLGAITLPTREAQPAYGVLAGYSFANRLDLLYGFVPTRRTHQLQAVLRF